MRIPELEFCISFLLNQRKRQHISVRFDFRFDHSSNYGHSDKVGLKIRTCVFIIYIKKYVRRNTANGNDHLRNNYG